MGVVVESRCCSVVPHGAVWRLMSDLEVMGWYVFWLGCCLLRRRPLSSCH